jgi:hypothetical protein
LPLGRLTVSSPGYLMTAPKNLWDL